MINALVTKNGQSALISLPAKRIGLARDLACIGGASPRDRSELLLPSDVYTAMFADPEEISDEEVQADCWIAITGYDD